MKNKIKNILLCLMIAGISSCDDFVEIHDKSGVSPEYFPVSVKDLNAMLTDVYSQTHSTPFYGFRWYSHWILFFSHEIDLAELADWYTIDGRKGFPVNHAEPNVEIVGEIWRVGFTAIREACDVLESTENYRNTLMKSEEEDQVNYIRGQALFLRAFFYWHLQAYCLPDKDAPHGGLPLMTKTPASLAEMQCPRSTSGEVWALMISDLEEAARLLEGKTDPSRVTEWAAKGFLGKVYVSADQWDNARTVLKDVIDNSGKGLVDFNIYKKMFHGEYEFNKESLYEIDFTEDWTVEAGQFDDGGVGSGASQAITPFYMGGDYESKGTGWGNSMIPDKSIARFGWNLNDKLTLKNNTVYKPGVKTNTRNMKELATDNYIEKSRRARENKTVDPRLYICTYQPYIDSLIVEGDYHFVGQPKQFNISNGFHAWNCKKYTNNKGLQIEINNHDGFNRHFLRMADIYLLYAEALTKTGGSTTEALEYINKVHRRAYGCDPNTPSLYDYPSLTAPTASKGPNDPIASNPLRYERWAEFYGEGQWWWDVRRWHIGQGEANYYQSSIYGPIRWTEGSYAQPIPTAELDLNRHPGMIQNPDY